jgi:hypothetical protein
LATPLERRPNLRRFLKGAAAACRALEDRLRCRRPPTDVLPPRSDTRVPIPRPETAHGRFLLDAAT